jgi:prolyl-tRNA synthetase
MRLTHYFLPILKETPAEAQIVSHRLMLRAGMIFQASAGIYAWLPLGTRVLQKIKKIIREEQDRAGAQEILMPTIQSADLWQESGRYNAYGQEMLRMTDRHDREMLYSPTAEELVTDIARKHIKSYRELPKMLYQIQWKFRDEIRPRFGVMRGREFLMKDCYSFDLNYEGALLSYRKMLEAYIKTFSRMGLTAIPVKADSGAIGGDLSQEFQIIAPTGESLIYYDQALDQIVQQRGAVDIDQLMNLYAAEEGLHDPLNCPIPPERLKTARGIEVGHIFYFATKYSDAFNAVVVDKNSNPIPLHMGSYGIGVSRLIGALIEANHDDDGIIWPESVAPFSVGIMNLKPNDNKCSSLCEEIYQQFLNQNIEVLYDDRNERAGVKFATMDLIGLPWQLRVGERALKAGQVELRCRRTKEVQELSVESALSYIKQRLSS